MKVPRWSIIVFAAGLLPAQDNLAERSRRYLLDLIRLDTSNPPGNETRVAQYLKRVAERESIDAEVLGGDPSRLNFIARLPGSRAGRPLLLMAHSDVVPAEAAYWSVAPFAGIVRDGFINGRGALDAKSLLAAELSVLVELKRTKLRLARDVILLAEADEESASSGIRWLIRNAWPKINAEFAINEGGFVMDLPSGVRLFQVQTTEKVPMPVVLRARGTAGHGSLPRADNPVLRLARATVRLADTDQPVRLNATTRRYLEEMSKLDEYAWLAPIVQRLQRMPAARAAANEIAARDLEIAAQLRTTVSPDVIHAGTVFNVIPAVAEVQMDVRRLPNETREEVMARLISTIHDNQIEVTPLPGHDMPATEPSSLATAAYQAMESVLRQGHAHSIVVPYMQRGATDGSFLREKGMAVYGAPLFLREELENRAHGIDERISPEALAAGTKLLLQIVTRVAAP